VRLTSGLGALGCGRPDRLSRGVASDAHGSTGKPEPRGLSERREQTLCTETVLGPDLHRYRPHRGVRRDPGVHSRLIRAVSTRGKLPTSRVPISAFWAYGTIFGAPARRPGMAMRALARAKGAPARSRVTTRPRRGPRRTEWLASLAHSAGVWPLRARLTRTVVLLTADPPRNLQRQGRDGSTAP